MVTDPRVERPGAVDRLLLEAGAKTYEVGKKSPWEVKRDVMRQEGGREELQILGTQHEHARAFAFCVDDERSHDAVVLALGSRREHE